MMRFGPPEYFDQIFELADNNSPDIITGYRIGIVDIGYRYAAASEGSTGPATKFKTGNVDLATIFAAKGSVVIGDPLSLTLAPVDITFSQFQPFTVDATAEIAGGTAPYTLTATPESGDLSKLTTVSVSGGTITLTLDPDEGSDFTVTVSVSVTDAQDNSVSESLQINATYENAPLQARSQSNLRYETAVGDTISFTLVMFAEGGREPYEFTRFPATVTGDGNISFSGSSGSILNVSLSRLDDSTRTLSFTIPYKVTDADNVEAFGEFSGQGIFEPL